MLERRQFIKIGGFGTASLVLPGAGRIPFIFARSTPTLQKYVDPLPDARRPSADRRSGQL